MVALVQDIIPGSLRTGVRLYLFTVHLVGSTLAPALIGSVSDATDLQTAMFIVVGTNFLGGIFLLL